MRLSFVRTLGSIMSTLVVLAGTIVVMNVGGNGTASAHPLTHSYCELYTA